MTGLGAAWPRRSARRRFLARETVEAEYRVQLDRVWRSSDDDVRPVPEDDAGT
jgi:hypothetical protein